MTPKPNLLKLATVVALILILVLAGAGTLYWTTADSHSEQSAKPAPPPQEVTVIELQSQQIRLAEELPGRVVAYNVAEIRPQADGIITERLFTEGGEVTQGQQLYQINPAPYQAAYSSAEAGLARAEANLKTVKARANRYNSLAHSKAISQQEHDDTVAQLAQAEADIRTAKATLQTAKINLDYTRVYAPISGRISRSHVTRGALVTANQSAPLATITQLDPIYVEMTQPVSAMARLRKQAKGEQEIPVLISISGETDIEYRGKLQFSEVSVDPSTGSVRLRAIFNNPDGLLLPGMFVRARLLPGITDAILVPQNAAIRNPDGSLVVWVLNADNQVAPRPIQAQRTLGNHWVVDSGISDGETIVLEGFQKIAPGATVNPVYAEGTEKSITAYLDALHLKKRG